MKDFYQQSPCPICGNREYSWGAVIARGICYVDQNASAVNKHFGFGRKTSARHCGICGNVQIFTRDEVEENR